MIRILSAITLAALVLTGGTAFAHHQLANCGSCGTEAHEEGEEAAGEQAGCDHPDGEECDCEHGEEATDEAAGCEHAEGEECDCEHGEEATDEAGDEATE